MTRRSAAVLLPVLLAAPPLALAACRGAGGATLRVQRERLEALPSQERGATVEGERAIALPLAADDLLIVDHWFGDVEVRSVADAPARARARIEVSAGRARHAAEFLRDSRLETIRTEEGLRLRLEQPPPSVVDGSGRPTGPRYISSATLTIDVPPGTRLSLTTIRGDVTATGPLGATRIVTGQGDIRMRRVRGGAIAKAGVGDVKLRQLEGGPIRAETDHGMIGLLGTRAESIRCRARRGRIIVNDSQTAALEVRTDAGDIRLAEIEGEIDAATAAGTLSVTGAAGARIQLQSDEGPLEVHDVRAVSLIAFAARGALTVERAEADRFELSTETGEMVLTDLVGNLVAHTEVGRIDAERLRGERLALSSGLDGVHLRGAIGRVEAFSRRGLITVAELTGGLEATTAIGPIRAEGILDGCRVVSGEGRVRVIAHDGSRVIESWSVRAEHGDVVVTLPAAFAGTVEAVAEAGTIDSQFPILLEAGVVADSGRLRGMVGDAGEGAGEVTLEARRGNVDLRRGED